MKILFIDDDPDDTDLFCEVVAFLNETELVSIQHRTIECLTANSGCAAVEILRRLEAPPDLIFMDINMPMMSGKECLQHLKHLEKYAKIPIVMLSTTCTDDQIKELKMLGAVDCITKPTSFNGLVKLLSKHVYAEYF